MSMYKGRLWLVPNRDSKLRVEIHLDSESIKITSNEVVIGDWPISEVEVKEVGNNSFRLYVEGEEVVVSSRDPEFMPALLGPLAGDWRHIAARRSRSRFNAPLLSADQEDADQEDEESEQAPYVGSGDQSSLISRLSEESVEAESRRSRGAHRSARRLRWRTHPTTR